MPKPVVERYPNVEKLLTAAAGHFVEVVVAAQAEHGSAAVVLTGGSTGIGMLERVRAQPGDIDWSAVDFYWGDERFVPADDPERNELQARTALLDHVPVDPKRVHAISASDGKYRDPVEAAAAYAALLPAEFDLHLLGMGGEGHVNSLFPHTDAVREKQALVVAVIDSPKPPPVRVTLTLPATRQTRQLFIVVSSAAKADAVAAALNGATAEDVPAAGAAGSDRTLWLLDTPAAEKLP